MYKIYHVQKEMAIILREFFFSLFCKKARDKIRSPAFLRHEKSLLIDTGNASQDHTVADWKDVAEATRHRRRSLPADFFFALVASAAAVIVSASAAKAVVSAKSAAAEQKEDDPQAVVIAAEAASAVAVAADAG